MISVARRLGLMKNFHLSMHRHAAVDCDSGNLSDLKSGFRPGGQVILFSATVDFVF
jgi:hypothetical protein